MSIISVFNVIFGVLVMLFFLYLIQIYIKKHAEFPGGKDRRQGYRRQSDTGKQNHRIKKHPNDYLLNRETNERRDTLPGRRAADLEDDETEFPSRGE